MSSKFRYFVSELERESLAEEILTEKQIYVLSFVNIFINSMFGSFILWNTHFNLIVFGISFIVFDMFLGCVDNYIFNIRPHSIENWSVEKLQKYVDKLKNKLDISTEKYSKFSIDNCRDCRFYNSYREYCTAGTRMCFCYSDVLYLKRQYEKYKKILDKKLETVAEEMAVSDTRKSEDFTDKLDYIRSLRAKIEVYVKKNDFRFLKSVLKSLTELIKILEKKPIGVSLVPNTVYIYLDELVLILNQLTELESENREEYIEKVDKISTALSDNIQQLTKRITESEENSIDISIKTLMKELVSDSKEENL